MDKTRYGHEATRASKMRRPAIVHTLGKRLRLFREARGITQRELAAMIHVGRTAVTNWENDRDDPSLLHLRQIAAYLDVTLSYLVDQTAPHSSDPDMPAPYWRRASV